MGYVYSFEDFELAIDRHELRRAGARVKADGLSLRLLEAFVREPENVITKQMLVASGWGNRAVSESALSVALTRLRKVLGREAGARELVTAVRRQGYRFSCKVIRTIDSRCEPRTGSGVAGVGRSPFVGRERVVRLLKDALLEAVSGRGNAVVLTGEQGIGKTRTLEVITREAAVTNLQIVWGYCREPSAASSLWPFARLLRELIDRVPSSLHDGCLGALARELACVLPGLGPCDAAAACQLPVSKLALFDMIARLLGLAAEHAPLVVVLDDLHRADAVSRELFHYLLDDISHRRILLLATARSGPYSAEKPSLAGILGHRRVARIALQPLSETQVASYLRLALGTLNPVMCRAVFDKSDGNPFLMTELAQQLRDSERWEVGALTLSSAALELTRERVAGLNAVARETLACAAVIGRYFSLPVLRAVTARPINELMESLDQGLAVGMIRRAGDSLSRFVFSRDCVRVAVYELLEPAQRRHWHLRLAEALDQASELGHASASERAEHALAALPEGDPCKAGRYCIEAAHAALSVHAYSEVARFLENARQALAWVEGGDARACAGLLSGQAAARVAASCASGDQRCAPSNPCPACRVTNMATAPLKLVSWVPNE